jgi:glycerol-3-phosphate dehydrogenase
VTIPIDTSRVSFALPWQGTLLLGTTDEPYSDDPNDVSVTEADEAQVLGEAGLALEAEILGRDRILARFAGLRVLPAAPGRTSAARRETRIVREQSGMFTVAGGKLTTYRRIAAAALEAMRPELGLRTVSPSTAPLPGAVDPRFQAEAILRSHPELDADTAGMLSRTYGSLSAEVLALADTDQALIEPLAAGVDVLAAQVVYARDYEWAVTAEDVLRRRTTLSLSGGDSTEVRDRVGELLSYGVVTAPGSS